MRLTERSPAAEKAAPGGGGGGSSGCNTVGGLLVADGGRSRLSLRRGGGGLPLFRFQRTSAPSLPGAVQGCIGREEASAFSGPGR